MKIPIINQDENISETAAILNPRYSFTDISKVNIKDCLIYQRGKYLVVEYNNVVYSREATGNYCYIEDAIHWMKLIY